jgi:hypothetical protein
MARRGSFVATAALFFGNTGLAQTRKKRFFRKLMDKGPA